LLCEAGGYRLEETREAELTSANPDAPPTKARARRDLTAIRVYCLPDERAAIEANAAAAGMSVGAFLREVGQGYRVTGTVDAAHVRELARINGDLGRLGGLLKLWLSDPRKSGIAGPGPIRALLKRLEAQQAEMARAMLSIARPGSKS
jgi:hypothetical protein